MLFNRKSLTVLGLGVLLRATLTLFSGDLQSVLDGRVEITTPVSSFKRLREGLFLYSSKAILSRNFDIYNGGVFHQSPILLLFFKAVQNSGIPFHIIFILADLLAAICIHAIADNLSAKVVVNTGEKKKAIQEGKDLDEASNPKLSQSPDSYQPQTSIAAWAVTAVYFFNPFTLLGSIAQSTSIFTNTLIIASITAAVVWKRPLLAILLLALATTLSLYPICLLPPLISCALAPNDVKNVPSSIPSYILDIQNQEDKGKNFSQVSRKRSISAWALMVGAYVLYVIGFIYSSYVIAGSWKFLESTYMTVIFVQDLTPNIGLWWYFFVEMFSFFRNFFISVFQLFAAAFSIPMTIRLHSYPLFALTTIVGIVTLFRSYPEISDLGLYLSLLALFRPVLDRIKYSLPVGFALLYSVALAPTFYHLWIYLGSGNSNFFYAITLVYALGITIAISDTMWAALRLEYDGGKNAQVSQY